MHTYIHTYIYIYTYVHMHMLNIYIYTYIHVHMISYTMYIYIYAYVERERERDTHTHTHTSVRSFRVTGTESRPSPGATARVSDAANAPPPLPLRVPLVFLEVPPAAPHRSSLEPWPQAVCSTETDALVSSQSFGCTCFRRILRGSTIIQPYKSGFLGSCRVLSHSIWSPLRWRAHQGDLRGCQGSGSLVDVGSAGQQTPEAWHRKAHESHHAHEEALGC